MERPLPTHLRNWRKGPLALSCPAMRKFLREFGKFGVAPLIFAFVCLFGLVGGFTEAEVLVPIYSIGLIASVTALFIYSSALLFRALRWLSAKVA